MHDLTHPVESGMQTYPGDPSVRVEAAASHEEDGYRVSRIALGSHAGTHVDAPAHTEPDGRTLDAFDVEAFVRDCVLVDCRDLDDREPITRGRVPGLDGADCVVFRTGWDAHWGTERYLDHPYLSPATAEACVARDVAVGTDTLGPDPTPTDRRTDDEPEGLPAHHALLGKGHLLFENLRGLGGLSDRFELRAHPLRLDADAAPVRAVGVPGDHSLSSR